MNKKVVLIIVAVILFLCCVSTIVLVFVFKDPIMNLISPTSTPTPSPELLTTVAPTSTITGIWTGSYTVTNPRGCLGTGSWSATLLELNGTLSGAYTSDVGVAGSVTGTISGSNVTWNVGGGGGATFNGNINGTGVSGNFTGPICSGNTHTTGTFNGTKQQLTAF